MLLIVFICSQGMYIYRIDFEKNATGPDYSVPCFTGGWPQLTRGVLLLCWCAGVPKSDTRLCFCKQFCASKLPWIELNFQLKVSCETVATLIGILQSTKSGPRFFVFQSVSGTALYFDEYHFIAASNVKVCAFLICLSSQFMETSSHPKTRPFDDKNSLP